MVLVIEAIDDVGVRRYLRTATSILEHSALTSTPSASRPFRTPERTPLDWLMLSPCLTVAARDGLVVAAESLGILNSHAGKDLARDQRGERGGGGEGSANESEDGEGLHLERLGWELLDWEKVSWFECGSGEKSER